MQIYSRDLNPYKSNLKLVGVAGFEPATTAPPERCATRLRYTPINDRWNIYYFVEMTTVIRLFDGKTIHASGLSILRRVIQPATQASFDLPPQ